MFRALFWFFKKSGLFWSFKKSARLLKIARILTPEPDGGESLMGALAKGGFDGISPRMNQIENGEKQLFALVRDDPVTSKMLQEHGLSDDDLDKLYWKLVGGGAGVFAKGHWIPASSLAYGQTLEYVLRHKEDDHDRFRKVCYRLRQYFSENETGEIEE
ncbi:MAG: hypothetical protein V2A58_11235 [Planctomycetota bacterium]